MYVPLFADIITAEKWLMIMPKVVLSNFLIYCVINAFTPGPGNILALNTVTNYGYKKGKPLFFELVIATIGTIATCTWIGLGVLIQKFYLRHFRVINIILALTLLECTWGMLR